MKRVLALVLALLMVVPFVACGDEKDFNVSKEVFTRVHDAAEKIDAMASDIYEAWRIGIDCNMESLKYVDDLSFLTNTKHLTAMPFLLMQQIPLMPPILLSLLLQMMVQMSLMWF